MNRAPDASCALLDESTRFVERALVDFGLIEEFDSMPVGERAEYLLWIAAAGDCREQEVRVSHLLDILWLREALHPRERRGNAC